MDEHVSAWNEAVWLAGEALDEAMFVDHDAMRRRLDALRELHESVTILDRAAEAASPPLTLELMRDQVGGLKRDACAILTDLAEGRRQGQPIRAMDETLASLRRAIEAEDPGGRGRRAERRRRLRSKGSPTDARRALGSERRGAKPASLQICRVGRAAGCASFSHAVGAPTVRSI